MDWIRRQRLGHGSFAAVNLAVNRNPSSHLPPLMAVKSCGVLQSSSLVSEKNILNELKDCPEIIRCFGDSVSCENGERLYNVLLEYASGGSLADKVKSSVDRRLPEIEVRRYAKALLKGLNYIHKFGYVHCDIKLQNILLGYDGGLKIADFGLAKRVGERGAAVGTPLYMSPEIVAGGDQGTPADIWALGCVISEMIGGSPAWKCSDVAALFLKIGVGEELPEIPGIFSEEGKDFLKKCFVKDPTQRWTAEMLLRHPFVTGQELDGDVVSASRNAQQCTATISPRCPFDFPDWATSTAACSITSLPSSVCVQESGSRSQSIAPADRLGGLVSLQGPNWSVPEDWVTVR